ncbi:MAG TPA: phosphoserine phosphatase SerB [Rhodocyclaceae bacterium]|nr:phosphoserine phosphatase SerB [Rhodocyclaceae bacterium]HMV52941.1 phosphoserine phosphatase SerB [Rhodocyclaceae bacterium]HMZ83265.1 phosphoserine phosphatase SerB [Rhodocyclaceae bacterium]HNA03232.1 phosphoserine phosphatase SerB [Rhodocyclaceae bacterium]HNB78514.1 phosphoserine phosphatase SerB [Rhodocyclaceae bacterium]
MNLVVQGAEVETRWLKELAHLVSACAIEQINTQAFRLRDAAVSPAVAEYCLERSLDYGYVPPGRRLSDMRLFVTDMDSTLITIECIDEIADMQGLKPQVAAITESAMRGEMDFCESLRRRVGLLAGLEESALQRVHDERLSLSPGAERLMKQLKTAGVKTMLVSGGFTFFTERIKARLGFDYAHSNVLEIEAGRLTGRVIGDIVDGEAKRRHLIEARNALGAAHNQVIAAGDGANDLKMLGEAEVNVAYRAKPVVRAQAAYALNFVGLDGILNLFE